MDGIFTKNELIEMELALEDRLASFYPRIEYLERVLSSETSTPVSKAAAERMKVSALEQQAVCEEALKKIGQLR